MVFWLYKLASPLIYYLALFAISPSHLLIILCNCPIVYISLSLHAPTSPLRFYTEASIRFLNLSSYLQRCTDAPGTHSWAGNYFDRFSKEADPLEEASKTRR